MLIGTVARTTNENGYTTVDLSRVTAENCTVNFGDWHDYYYCEFEENTVGSEYYGEMDVQDNIVSIDMKNAYPVEIASFIRKFQMLEEKIILTDTFDSSLNVKERFITEIEPIIDGENNIIIAGAKLCVSSAWRVFVTSRIINRYDGKTKRKVFILDFTTKEITDKFEMEIIFE